MPQMCFQLLLLLAWSLLVEGSREPRIINLREAGHPDLQQALDQGLLQTYTGGNGSAVAIQQQHFRLLELDGDHLLVGAADSVHNLSLANLHPAAIYRWEPGADEQRDCQMKSMDETLCRNFVRVLGRLSNDRLLVCGTNAFRPACRILSRQWEVLAELPGIGLTPPEPGQNSSHLVASNSDVLYSATVADFAGTDPLLFRRNVSDPDDQGLRTQRGNTLQLDRPQFVGALQSEQFVYTFFREDAAEADLQPASYSRVARVCKTDRGGPRHYSQEWTSFVKARLNCSIAAGAHGRPFYFDQLVALSQPVHDGLVYATFVSEFDFLRHSVVCAFRLGQIDTLFRSGPYLAYEPAQRRWTRRPRDDLTSGLGQCQPDSSKMSEDEALARRKFPLMADAVPNALPGGAAAGIHRGGDHYSQIAVLPGVRHDAGRADILYVATDQGNVLKLAILADSAQNTTSSIGEDPLVPVATLQLAQAPIRRLLVSASAKALVVVTDSVVYRLPLHFCGFHTTCVDCVGSRDPHCVWHAGKCRDREEAFAENSVQKPVQDVLATKGEQICAGLDASRETAKKHAEEKQRLLFVPLGSKTPNMSKSGMERTKFNGNSAEKCECAVNEKKGNAIAKCDCGQSPEQQLLLLEDPKNGGNEESVLMRSHALPWWVLLLVVLAVLQTLAFVWLCCKWHGRRSKGLAALGADKRLSPASQFSSQNSAGGLISAYSPASILSAPIGVKELQSDHWTLSTSGCSNRSSSTSPKGSAEFVAQARPNGTTGGGFFQSWSLLPRRASVSGGEISVQLEGSAAPSAGFTTLPLHLPLHYCQQQPAGMSTFRR